MTKLAKLNNQLLEVLKLIVAQWCV